LRRRFYQLLPALLLSAALAPPSVAGSPSATLTWEAEGSRSAEVALLLVLELGPEGPRLLDARTAPVRAKVRRDREEDQGPIFALLDRGGRPLAVGRLRVPSRLHGPVLDEAGEVRCVSVPLDQVVVAVRVPMPAGATRFQIFEAADFSPSTGQELAAALGARPADAGLHRLASFDVGALAEGDR